MLAVPAHLRNRHLLRRQPRVLLFAVPLFVAVVCWALDYVFVADGSRDALIALPVWLAAGAVVGWLAMTLWKRSQALRRAESRFASVEDAASDAIVRVDRDGVIASWSPGAKAIYGYGNGEIVGRPLSDLFADPEGARVLEDTPASGETIELRRRDGTVFSASVLVSSDDEGAIVVARDLGELRRVKSELGNAEARYRSLTEHLPVVTYVQSLEGERETTYVSPQLDKLLGYKPHEWLEDPDLFLRLVHPEDRGDVVAARKAADSPNGIRSTYRMLARDGRVVWVREEAVAVRNESGRPLCLQGYLLDISERKAAEQERGELRAAQAETADESRDRQRKIDFVAEAATILASSGDLRATIRQVAALATRDLAEWCIVDELHEEGTFTHLAAERAQSRSSSDEPGLDPELAVSDVIRRRRPEVSDSRMLLPLISRGGRVAGALTLVAGDNAPAYSSDDLPWASALAGMIALAIDNARLYVEVEARQDANRVLRHVGDGVFLLDRDGVIRLWNPASAEIIGVSVESAQGKPASEAIPGWHELSELAPVGTAREPARPLALPIETERGERWISISGVVFGAGTVYAFRDITEEHQLEELKAEFIATASHELRTPLAAVYGAAQTLRRHDFALDEAGRERFISLIVDEADRLAQIVNQILLANQLEVGRVDLEPEPFEPGELVERVVESAKTHAPDSIIFHTQLASSLPAVAADKDRARQVLVNLVENAVKYSPRGGRIEVGAERGDGAVVFRVVDEGMGIPAEEQSRIFEKFYRLDPNLTKGIGGTGLGLYICSELVERMGGRIWLESEEGKGSAFFFQLPIGGAHPVLPKARELAERERVS
ncbi:MAG TPA: PAS domain S-box protein [Gaiellaceae bacterium]|nr:PAS domain S-box protein [Gaiellaceae bacterium]